jgi:death-on-curing protein
VIEWLAEAVVLAIHDEQVGEHGGLAGIRDLGALQSALARPQQLLAYADPRPDVAALAAAYGFAIATSHPFADGNKRTSYIVTEVFLLLNGHQMDVDEAARVDVWTRLGAGSITEEQLADWLRAHITEIEEPS